MKARIPSFAIAGFLLLCIALGGSAQSPWTNLGLQLAAVCLLAYSAIGRPSDDEHGKRGFAINALLLCTLLLVLIQLVPLPEAVWTRFPGRSEVADGLARLGYPIGAAPISLMPYDSLFALFAMIPAIGVFVATERLRVSPRAIAAATVAGMIAAVFVGALQVAGGPTSSAYFYPIHNPGAVGFFANGNHMATLLLASIPMTAALVVTAKTNRRLTSTTRYGLGIAVLLFVIVGIVLNGSRAAFGLAVPVFFASVSLFPAAVRWRRAVLTLSAIALAVAVALILRSPLSSAETSAANAADTRSAIWATSAHAVEDSFPVGTGLGTFERVYHRYEDPQKVSTSYVNHAHNDYLEVMVELGAGGALLILAFLAWWLVVAAKIWTSTYSSPFARAATIATAAMLAHSVVDFPLRTAAISAIFAGCIALMARHLQPAAAPKAGERRPTRHVTLG